MTKMYSAQMVGIIARVCIRIRNWISYFSSFAYLPTYICCFSCFLREKFLKNTIIHSTYLLYLQEKLFVTPKQCISMNGLLWHVISFFIDVWISIS